MCWNTGLTQQIIDAYNKLQHTDRRNVQNLKQQNKVL